MLSPAEKKRRTQAAAGLIGRLGLEAVYLPGNGTVATNAFGCFRYFTDCRVFFFLMSIVMFKDGEPVGVANNLMSKLSLQQKSFVSEAVISANQIEGVTEILKSRGVTSGRVGTLLEVLPASWLLTLRAELPNIEFVDISEEIFSIRAQKSAEEIEAQRICGRIADAGYQEVCNSIEPGMYENEVVALMDRAMQRLGSEESFALITSGKFNTRSAMLPGLHNYTASNRKIERGDVVGLEITPRYNGYWTQIARTVCVGERNSEADILRGVIVEAIGEAKTIMRAHVPISDLVRKMRQLVEGKGYNFAMPCGHIAAIDLNEERLTEDNDRLLTPGMMLIIHPTVLNDNLTTGIFWGESYLITEGGYEPLMKSNDELFIIGK